MEQVLFTTMLENYFARNETTYIADPLPVWTAGKVNEPRQTEPKPDSNPDWKLTLTLTLTLNPTPTPIGRPTSSPSKPI